MLVAYPEDPEKICLEVNKMAMHFLLPDDLLPSLVVEVLGLGEKFCEEPWLVWLSGLSTSP